MVRRSMKRSCNLLLRSSALHPSGLPSFPHPVINKSIDLFLNTLKAVSDGREVILFNVALVGKAHELTKLLMDLERGVVLVLQPPSAEEEGDCGDERDPPRPELAERKNREYSSCA